MFDHIQYKCIASSWLGNTEAINLVSYFIYAAASAGCAYHSSVSGNAHAGHCTNFRSCCTTLGAVVGLSHLSANSMAAGYLESIEA